MLDRLVPARVDQKFVGHGAALWLLAVLMLMRLAMSINVIFNGADVATNADGVPLGSYPPEAAQTVVVLFGLWGIAQLVLSLMGALVLGFFRFLVPLMFALLLLEQLVRRLYLIANPLPHAGGSAGPYVNLLFLTLTIVGLVLSVWKGATRP